VPKGAVTEIVPVLTEQVGSVTTTVGATGKALNVIAVGVAVVLQPFASVTNNS
jgi:hypothetical protein